MNEQPRVSVVVPTYRRAHLLPRLVAALEAQQDAPPFEVVIVDNASPDDTAAVLEELTRRAAVPLIVERVPRNRGPAGARNVGWRAARGQLVAFMDDDCVPTGTWLRELHHSIDAADMIQGRTEPDPEQAAGLGPFSRTMSVTNEDGLYATCNIAYRRELLERLDGFDESFEAGGEDTDLAWRALASGATTTFTAAAVVRHDVRASSWLVQLRDTTHWHSLPLILAKHPALRDRLHRRLFWRATHPPAILAGVGVIAIVAGGPRLRGAGVAMTLPYARARLVSHPLPYTGRRDRLKYLPAALAVDLAEVAVLTAGSLRHRSLML